MTDAHQHIALLDANILASITLADIFVQLTVDNLFLAKWTVDIHREWIAAVLKFQPHFNAQRLERRRLQMDTEARDALVTGYENLVADLNLPDPNDRHVLAAAIAGNCNVIVTQNLRDFPADILLSYGLKAQHPDDFLVELLHLSPGSFCAVVRKVRVRLKNPPYNIEEYLAKLARASLPQTETELAAFPHLLA